MSARYALEGVTAEELDPAKLADRREVSLKTSTSTLSESFLGTSALIRQGADFIAEEGLRAMTAAADGRAGAVPFAAATGGRSTYETGSRMRLKGVSLVTGAAMKRDSLTAALFFEASRADSVSRSSGNRGDADHEAYGVGAALRYEWTSPFYLEVAARFGRAETEFSGRYADASARYRMEDVDAHAVRFGALWRGNASEHLSWRIGAAYERVFDGDAESTLNDIVPLKLETPTLEGHYGIFEMGALMKPSESSP